MSRVEIDHWCRTTQRDLAPWEIAALLTLDEILTHDR